MNNIMVVYFHKALGELFSQNSHFSSPIHVLMKAKKPKSLIEAIVMKKPLTGVMTVEQQPYHVAPLCPSFELLLLSPLFLLGCHKE